MGDFADVLVSRSDIARMAGVRRPAVTNWQRRHSDFPAPVDAGQGSTEPGAFRAGDVLEWLSGRTVPSNALRPEELPGVTYGDRFRAAIGGGDRPGGFRHTVERLARQEADALRGRLNTVEFLYLLLHLVYVRSRQQQQWSSYVADPATVLRDVDLPRAAEVPLDRLVGALNGSTPPSPDEGRETFDHLLALLQDFDARTAAEFFTPESVSRVMAGALATHRASVRRLHDPFCRTGELLTGYLDAVAVHGAGAPQEVSGRAAYERALRLTRMNLVLRGVERPDVQPGFWTPSRGPADPPAQFDAVITNPPFALRLDPSVAPQDYWRYGVSRSGDFDWLQYVVTRLTEAGRAAVLMGAGAGFRGGFEGKARARMVRDGVVTCVMALPPGLFARTSIPTQIWFLRAPRGRAEPILFVDGGALGSMASRTRRVLTDDDIDNLVRAYESWTSRGVADQPGLARAAGPEEIEQHDFRLDPALYVKRDTLLDGAADPAEARGRLTGLAEELERLRERADEVDRVARERLRRYGL
ncbi:N-6 DNA methylase [Streptomyces sp. PRKS01-65]|nr:N-6 DNA methylase [Streptomyces harenosi]NEY33540.1 N-6 DNA methylase [Streptomyces harenosi]